jgi:hypothetical protein
MLNRNIIVSLGSDCHWRTTNLSWVCAVNHSIVFTPPLTYVGSMYFTCFQSGSELRKTCILGLINDFFSINQRRSENLWVLGMLFKIP